MTVHHHRLFCFAFNLIPLPARLSRRERISKRDFNEHFSADVAASRVKYSGEVRGCEGVGSAISPSNSSGQQAFAYRQIPSRGCLTRVYDNSRASERSWEMGRVMNESMRNDSGSQRLTIAPSNYIRPLFKPQCGIKLIDTICAPPSRGNYVLALPRIIGRRARATTQRARLTLEMIRPLMSTGCIRAP